MSKPYTPYFKAYGRGDSHVKTHAVAGKDPVSKRSTLNKKQQSNDTPEKSSHPGKLRDWNPLGFQVSGFRI